MDKRKVIVTVTNDLTYDRRMIRICETLVENGMDVLLVGRKLHSSKPLKNMSFKQRRLRCFFNSGPLFYAEINIRLLVFLLRNRPDKVYSVDLDTLPAGFFASRSLRRELIYDAHEYFTEVPEVQGRRWVKKIWEWVADRLIHKANLVITVSEAIANEFRVRYQVDPVVIRNVPPAKKAEMVLNEEIKRFQPYMIYQGALNQGRCIEHYIQLAKELEYNLLIAGEGDLSDKLRDLARGNPFVHFLGWVSPENLYGYTSGASIGLNVLEDIGKSYYFSLSNKCFDYVQNGVPQLSSNFPEYESLNAEHEVMVTCEPQKDEVGMALKLLLTDHDKYEYLKKNCLIAATHWCWEIESKKLSVLYDEL